MVLMRNCCEIDLMASIDKRMMIKTLKQFLQVYVGAKADNFDVSTLYISTLLLFLHTVS